jgi:hypothetical protein
MNRLIHYALIGIVIMAAILIVLTGIAKIFQPSAGSVLILLLLPALALAKIGILQGNITENEAVAISLGTYALVIVMLIIIKNQYKNMLEERKNQGQSSNKSS